MRREYSINGRLKLCSVSWAKHSHTYLIWPRPPLVVRLSLLLIDHPENP